MTTDTDNGSNENTIEKAFELIELGKDFERKEEHWKAADGYFSAETILQSLANEQPRETEEEKQIAELYEQQGIEYRKNARQRLISAMEQETENPKESDFYTDMSDEEAKLRVGTFCSLFAKPVDVTVDETVEEQQHSLEERLQELNASLPTNLQTDKERMDKINRGMNRLGLSLYDQKEPFARFQDELPKSEDEQVDDIIGQVNDEVAFEKKSNPGVTTKSKEEEDDDDYEDSEDDDDDEEDDLELDDEQLAIKHIRNRAVKAQTKLAELVALLDEAKDAKQREEEDDLASENSDVDIPKPDAEAYLTSGKKKLRSARKALKRALEEWDDSTL